MENHSKHYMFAIKKQKDKGKEREGDREKDQEAERELRNGRKERTEWSRWEMINYIENPTKSILIDGMPAPGSIFLMFQSRDYTLTIVYTPMETTQWDKQEVRNNI